MPKFSVVISVFNKAQNIEATLRSVLNQTFADFELIIINDASTDNSEEIILKIEDKRIKYFKNRKNLGAGGARNEGISKATSSLIALLDGDDIWKPNFLSDINALTNDFPDHEVFATAIEIEDLKGTRKAQYTFDNPEKKQRLSLSYFESSHRDALLHSSSTVVSKQAFETVGLYDSTIKSGQDTDLWIRLGIAYKIAFSTEVGAIYKIGSTSLYRSVGTMKDRPNFEKFKSVETKRPDVKKFIDLNRYSQAIRARNWGEENFYRKFKGEIDLNNLNKKQRFLLSAPQSVLRGLWKIRDMLQKLGIRLTAFS